MEDRRRGIIDAEKYPATLGITIELCAGIVDKDKSLAEIAAEEVFEECGYKVDPEKMEYIIQLRYSSTPIDSSLIQCDLSNCVFFFIFTVQALGFREMFRPCSTLK